MNNSAFENLKAAERIVKKGYRRWRNKLSPNELLGYNLFAELVSTVHASERFLLSSKVLEANTKAETKYVTKVAFKNHLENLEFDICSAFNGKIIGSKDCDVFVHFAPKTKGLSKITVYVLDHKFLKTSMTRSTFSELVQQFYLRCSGIKIQDEDVDVNYYSVEENPTKKRLNYVLPLAALVLLTALEKPDAKGEQRHARISDCDYVRGANGRYEAHNYYTYICEQADAQQFRNSVREKRQAHGYTGTGGTKAFHFRKAHWRYYQELGRDVFVRGYYAGRHKPEVNVIR